MKDDKILNTLFIICFLVLIIYTDSKAQNIFTGNVLLETQTDVITFGANNYTHITGNLEIGGYNSSGITDLTPLLNLTSINGDLIVSGIDATSINGLNNITIVGGELWIDNNLYLISIDELSGISMIGKSIYFEHNTVLLSLDGLIGIKEVNGQLYISRNRALTNVDGLKNITSISDTLRLFDNLLTNLDGLKSLKSIGATCTIDRHFVLENIDGLSNLTSVGENIKIHNNQNLTSIDGLRSLTSVGGNFQVTGHPLVDNFCSLFTLLNGGGLGGTYIVTGNLTNPTITEIIAGGSCLPSAVEVNFSKPTDFELSQNYPNPFNPTTTISYSIPSVETQNFASLQLKIYDVLGKEIATLVNEQQSPGDYKVQFDASRLPSGVYYYQLKTGEFMQIRKMMLLK